MFRQPVFLPHPGDLVLRGRPEPRGHPAVDHAHLALVDPIVTQHVAARGLGDDDDRARLLQEAGHHQREKRAIQRRVRVRQQVGHVVQGEDAGHAAQVRQQVVGPVEQVDAGQEAVLGPPQQMAQQHAQPPGLVAPRERQRGQTVGGRVGAGLRRPVVEDAVRGLRVERDQRGQQLLGMAADAPPMMDRGGEVQADVHRNTDSNTSARLPACVRRVDWRMRSQSGA
ncbi:MAG: hypothetical protein BWY52_00600 [Chloroflexi bacterium ADurb.Bin325]|nr:MAG: hypothetical protein BWY52_00600 [Chloroflexi bacterium ADurb.Bin325]